MNRIIILLSLSFCLLVFFPSLLNRIVSFVRIAFLDYCRGLTANAANPEVWAVPRGMKKAFLSFSMVKKEGVASDPPLKNPHENTHCKMTSDYAGGLLATPFFLEVTKKVMGQTR